MILIDINNFKSSLPNKLNEFELIALISKYAKLQHVAITSLSPAESKDMGLYDVINVSFEAMCDGFKDMILFLRKIEKSEFPLRVDSWSGHEAENGKITFSILGCAFNKGIIALVVRSILSNLASKVLNPLMINQALKG